MARLWRILSGLLLAALLPVAMPAGAQTPAAPSAADVRQLEARLDALDHQLDNLESAKNDAVRQTLLHQHWVALQDYMGEIHRRFGAGAPWMVDAESRGGPGASACPMLGGSGAGWPLPEGVTPAPYVAQMRPLAQTLSDQMDQIAKAGDPAERLRLLQEHWQTMYRQMQGMRGLGWMWGAGLMGGAPRPGAEDAKSLPDPDAPGAKLVERYCVQCHAVPSPTLKTGAEWDRVLHRMHLRLDTRVAPIPTPSDEELKAILAYMKQHAR